MPILLHMPEMWRYCSLQWVALRSGAESDKLFCP